MHGHYFDVIDFVHSVLYYFPWYDNNIIIVLILGIIESMFSHNYTLFMLKLGRMGVTLKLNNALCIILLWVPIVVNVQQSP